MVKLISASRIMFDEIRKDLMLMVCAITPVLLGIVFRFLLRILETELCEYLNVELCLFKYDLIFDLLLCLTTTMFTFTGTMVVLGEMDEGIASYFICTPLGKRGYMISRIGVPAGIAVLYDIVVIHLFHISSLSTIKMIILSLLSGFLAVIVSMFVLTFARNRSEGMACTKLCGFLLLGLPVPFFLHMPVRYVAGILPSIAEYAITGSFIYVMIACVTLGFGLVLCFKNTRKNYYKGCDSFEENSIFICRTGISILSYGRGFVSKEYSIPR